MGDRGVTRPQYADCHGGIWTQLVGDQELTTMKAIKIIAISVVALAALAPVAHASTDTSVDTSSPTTPTTTTTTDTPTAPPVTTTTTTPPTTTVPPVTTTTTDVPETTGTTTTTTTTTDDVDLIPDDVLATDCLDATCAAGGVGGVPTGVVGSGRALPFTGISDIVAPMLLALVVLLAGIVVIRWAQLREAVARNASRRLINGSALVSRTGYAGALKEQQLTNRARNFFEPRVA